MSVPSGDSLPKKVGPRPDPEAPVRPDVVARARAVYCNGNGGLDPEDVLDTPGQSAALEELNGDLDKIPLNCNSHQRGRDSGAY